MPFRQLQKLILWPLIGLLSGIPLPWAHRHCDLEAESVVRHVALFHSKAPLISSTSWHLHFLDSKVPLPEAGLNTSARSALVMFDPSKLRASLERLILDELIRVNHLGQHATQLFDSSVASNFAFDRFVSIQVMPSSTSASREMCILHCLWQI